MYIQKRRIMKNNYCALTCCLLLSITHQVTQVTGKGQGQYSKDKKYCTQLHKLFSHGEIASIPKMCRNFGPFAAWSTFSRRQTPTSPCSCRIVFAEADFKRTAGSDTRFEASDSCAQDKCDRPDLFEGKCKCIVKNLVQKDSTTVFENFEMACKCISKCSPSPTGNTCGIMLSIISDDANVPNAIPPQPKLVRKSAQCICQERGQRFQCDCS